MQSLCGHTGSFCLEASRASADTPICFGLRYLVSSSLEQKSSYTDHFKFVADEKLIFRAQFMLTEVNHGLDARNIQTTATILPDGDIDLHTPSPNDAK